MNGSADRADGIILRLGRWLRALAFTKSIPSSPSVGSMPRRVNLPPQDELYNPRKAAQVVAYFALRQGDSVIEVLKAIKLIYLADRESLSRWGAPILHEPRFSLKLGPVNQTTLEYIDGDRVDQNGWSRFVSPRAEAANEVSVAPGITVSDLDEFSDADLAVLDEIWARHGRFASFPLAQWTHRPENVPEWRDPNGGRLPIQLIDILHAVGFPEPEVAIERIEEQRSIERSFRGSQ